MVLVKASLSRVMASATPAMSLLPKQGRLPQVDSPCEKFDCKLLLVDDPTHMLRPALLQSLAILRAEP